MSVGAQFREWDAFPDISTRFEDAFGRKATLHWGLRPRPMTAGLFCNVLKEVWTSDAMAKQFYDYSPFLSALEAR